MDDFHKPAPDELLSEEDLTEDWAFLFRDPASAGGSIPTPSSPASLRTGAAAPVRQSVSRPSPASFRPGEASGESRPPAPMSDETIVYRGNAPAPRPHAAPQEIDWADYDFNFDDEFGPLAAPEAPAPAAPQPASAPRPEAFSVDAMRRLHDGQRHAAPIPAETECARRAGPAEYPPGPVEYPPDPVGDAWVPPQEDVYGGAPDDPASKPPKKRKKHRALKVILLTLLALLVIGVGVLAVFWFTARQPQTDRPIGARKDGCSTILLAGTDEEGTRTDTIMLLYVDRANKAMRLLSIPRDTKVNRDNPVPKINGAYGANGLGEKGMNALMDYVQDLIGYRPDGYMLIDLNCFEELVDNMGGVDFNVPQDMHYEDPYQDLFIDLKAGQQHLNGKQAMWLVRFRSGYALQDMTRMEVQRDFLSAALRQWASVGKIFRIPGAFRLLREHTQTDLDASELLWLARSFLLCRGNGLSSRTLPGSNSDQGNGWYFYEDVDAAAALINESFNPYQVKITADMLHPYGR